MGLEAATYINDLTTTNPVSTDKRKQGDDHLRLIKSVLKTTFPNADRAFYFREYEAITTSETVAAADMNKVYGASTTGGAFTVTLPTSLTAADDGFSVAVVKLETNTNRLTVAPSSGTINGVASLSITNAGDRIDAYWTGSAWVGVVTLAGVDRVTLTAGATLDASHYDKLIEITPASANATLTLPAVADCLGRTITVKLLSGTYTCTLDGNSSETIDGATTWALENQYELVKILATASGWTVLEAIGAVAGTVPPGVGADYWGSTAPSGWLLCYGQAVSRSTYARLFAKISTTYGVGDGSTTFNLPDKRGRVTVGKDDMGGSSANRLTGLSGGINGDTLGETGGAESHTLTEAQLASHQHFLLADVALNSAGSISAGEQIAADNDSGGNATYKLEGTATAATIGDSSSTGSGAAHNNVQPSIVANYIIKY